MKLLAAILFLFQAVGFVDSTGFDEHVILQEGLGLEQEGKYTEALEYWKQALLTKNTGSVILGRAFIRLAAERELDSYYEDAVQFYLEGFSNRELKKSPEALKKELEFLEPLAGTTLYKHWEELLLDKDTKLFQQVFQFWQQLDPTPGTPYNERIIEHWQRIAYARSHFNYNNNSVYGTDDRGVIWVKYGKPNRVRTGSIIVSSGEIETIARIMDPDLRRPVREAMVRAAIDLHENPRYEVWIYEKPNETMQFNLVLMFGDTPGGGFQQITTLEDLVPPRAFTLTNRHEFLKGGGGAFSVSSTSEGTKSKPDFSPGMVLQWLYYEKLSTIDFYFSNVYSYITNNWDGTSPASTVGKSSGPILQEKTFNSTLQNINRSPEEFSSIEKNFPEIPLEAFPYRVLDMENRPTAIIFLESRPQKAFLKDLSRNQDIMYPQDTTEVYGQALDFYKLYHGLNLLPGQGETSVQERYSPEIPLEFKENSKAVSFFKVPYKEDYKLILYSELYNEHSETEPAVQSPFPNNLRGIGRIELSLLETLNANPDVLEMADIILGYQINDSLDSKTDFPFIVANNREIPEKEELVIHLEIYHLKIGENGRSNFEIEYEVFAEKRKGLARLFTSRDRGINLTVSQEVLGNRYAGNLQIQTRSLKPGKYVMQLKVTDLNDRNRQEVSREIPFEVIMK